jgi:hypothetical protein
MIRNKNFKNFFRTAYCFMDKQRNEAYESWISENVKDKTVIDLGAGSGILCYLAVKYGAKKVYALERRGRLIHRMKEILGDTVEYIHADLLEVDDLPECDIYLHEWLTSEFWDEKRFLSYWFKEDDEELEVGHILDLIEYATKHNFVDKLYPNTVELSDITGVSIDRVEQMTNLYTYSKYSMRFISDYYPEIDQISQYYNTVETKEVLFKGHIKDVKYMKATNALGWEVSFDDKHVLSNHLPISHWGLKDGSS